MKRFTSLMLCAFLLLSFQTVTANAAATPTISCESVTCAPGERITVAVTVTNNPGFTYLEMTPSYAEELTLVDVTNGALISDFTKGKQYVWVADKDMTANGLLMTFTFDVAQTVPAGTYSVGFLVRTCGNYNEEPVQLAVESGTVTVAQASATTDISDFTYELSGDELTITGYTGSKSNVTIAQTYEIGGVTYTVTAIGESAFEAGTITAVDIPDTVAAVGDYAFYDCTDLMKATVRNADAQIGDLAFGYYYISRREDGLVEGFVLEGWEGSTAQAYADTEGITFVALVEDSDVIYVNDDLQAALEQVQAGGTVVLTKDLTVKAATIWKDITLDLNGYTLTADYFTSYGAVVDGTDGGSGLVVANAGIHMPGNNPFLPIYDTAAGGYRFYAYQLQNLGYKTVAGADALKAGFRLILPNAEAYNVLANTRGDAVAAVSYINWGSSAGFYHYGFNDSTIRNFAALAAQDMANKGTTNMAMILTLTGISNMEKDTAITFQPALETEPGVVALADAANWIVQ